MERENLLKKDGLSNKHDLFKLYNEIVTGFKDLLLRASKLPPLANSISGEKLMKMVEKVDWNNRDAGYDIEKYISDNFKTDMNDNYYELGPIGNSHIPWGKLTACAFILEHPNPNINEIDKFNDNLIELNDWLKDLSKEIETEWVPIDNTYNDE